MRSDFSLNNFFKEQLVRQVRTHNYDFLLMAFGKIPCHTDHIICDFGGNIGGRQAINIVFSQTLF